MQPIAPPKHYVSAALSIPCGLFSYLWYSVVEIFRADIVPAVVSATLEAVAAAGGEVIVLAQGEHGIVAVKGSLCILEGHGAGRGLRGPGLARLRGAGAWRA